MPLRRSASPRRNTCAVSLHRRPEAERSQSGSAADRLHAPLRSALGEYVLDLTCAACHSGEIHARRTARPAPSASTAARPCMPSPTWSAAASRPTLLASLIATVGDPVEVRPLREESDRRGLSAAASRNCKAALRATIMAMLGSGQNNPLRKLYPVHEGFGRTDALGRIGNTAFGDHLIAANYQEATRRSVIRTSGTSGSSTGCSTTARCSSRWRAISARRSASARRAAVDRRCGNRAGRERYRSSVDIAGLDPHRAHAADAQAAALAGGTARRHRPEGRARRGAVRAALPGLPRPALADAARAAGERAAQALARARMADRSDSARAHRHRSRPQRTDSWSATTICRDRAHQCGSARLAAAAVGARPGARRALPPDAKSSAARRARRPARRLPALLAAYPDPDARRRGSIPRDTFRAIAPHSRAAMPCRRSDADSGRSSAGLRRSSASSRTCSATCATARPHRTQLDEARRHEAHRRRGPEHPRPFDQGRFFADNYRLRNATMSGRFRHARSAATDRRLQTAAAGRRVGDAAVPAQRLGAEPLRDAAAAGAARRRSSSSAAAISTRSTWATSRARRGRRRRRLLARHDHHGQSQHGPCVLGRRGDWAKHLADPKAHPLPPA